MKYRRSMVALTVALLLVSAACGTDPEVERQRALERGNAYFAQQKYAESVVEYRK